MIKRIIKKIYAKALREKLFLYVVIIPSTSILIYFSLIASNQYITESKFIIRSPQQQQGGSAALGLLFKGTSFARALDDIYSAQEYIESRNAMMYLDEELDLQRNFSLLTIDPISKFSLFGNRKANESFYKYYKKKVKLSQDSSSSILTLSTYGFDPVISLKMNELLLLKSEEIINKVNDRAKKDIINYSKDELNSARKKAENARARMAKYRSQNNIIDPEKQSIIQLQLISKIQDQIVIAKSQLSHMIKMSPENPNLISQNQLVISLENEVKNLLLDTAGGDSSLTSQSPEYLELLSDNIFTEKQLAAALSSYEGAINEANRQQLYLERIVNPNLSDKSTYPERIFSIISYILLLLVVWGISRFMLVAIREHNDS
jgi:capsular polysaccharide transport system permease protein